MLSIYSLGQLTAGALYFAFTLLLMLHPKWRKQRFGVLIAATGLNTVWLFSNELATFSFLARGYITYIELTRHFFWWWVLLCISGLTLSPTSKEHANCSQQSTTRWKGKNLYLLWMALGFLSNTLSFWFPETHRLQPTLELVLQLSFLLMAMWGLIWIENSYRTASANALWQLKFFFIGLGALFLFDFLFYSQALLSHELSSGLSSESSQPGNDNHSILTKSRGMLNLLVMPLLAIAIHRYQRHSHPWMPSHRIIFQSSTLFLVSLYLVLMGLSSYYFRFIGDSWGDFISLIFITIATILLVVVLTSRQARAVLQQTLQKHLLQKRYDYQAEWSNITNQLSEVSNDTDQLTLYKTGLNLMTDLVESHGGAIWILNQQNFFELKHKNNLALPDFIPQEALLWLQNTISTQTTFITTWPESTNRKAQWPDPWKTLDQAWLGVPLVTQQSVKGFIILAKPRIQITLVHEHFEILEMAARQLSTHIFQQEALHTLAENQQFSAMHQMSAFLLHDLKTLVAQLDLILGNAQTHKHNPNFIDDLFETLKHSNQKLHNMIQQLQTSSSNQTLLEGFQNPPQASNLDLADFLAKLMEKPNTLLPAPSFELPTPGLLVTIDPNKLEQCIIHLIRNAQQATPDNGSVRLFVTHTINSICLHIQDSGSGMNQTFIDDQLFQPFNSTKGLSGMGIGAYQARNYLRAIGGDLIVQSQPNKGSHFQLFFPRSLETYT